MKRSNDLHFSLLSGLLSKDKCRYNLLRQLIKIVQVIFVALYNHGSWIVSLFCDNWYHLYNFLSNGTAKAFWAIEKR